jgi:uncharacterized membrane protein YphA (DoxX/SURF4 family)
MMFPFPLGFVPGTQELARWVQTPIGWGVEALAHLLGLPMPSRAMTGSGDTLFANLELLLLAIVALVASIAWTAIARDRPHVRLARGLRVVLRYWLAATLCLYGFVKLRELQFHEPGAWILDQRVGDKSPMGLLWTFMGFSRPYTMLSGIAELVGCVLLVWRRTATLGAIAIAIVMANIAALNFCYDVPVKLFSLILLAAALAIAAPDLRRIIGAALGHATRDVPLPPRSSRAFERARIAAKLGFVACALYLGARIAVFPGNPTSELDGTWDVEQFHSSGELRWARVMIDDGIAAIRWTTERRIYYRVRIDPSSHVIALDRGFGPSGALTYTWRDPDHVVVHGAIGDTSYDATLVRAQPWLLMTRGFHWIQEAPFNR